MDETDEFEDVNLRKPRPTCRSSDLDAFMAMFAHKLAGKRQLAAQEVQVRRRGRARSGAALE